MKATESKLLQVLGAVSQFIIPIDQRTYSWTLKECQQLWADILLAGFTEEIGVHFIGSVVYIKEGLGNLTVQAPKLVIDGQQRLTTVTLLLTAMGLIRQIAGAAAGGKGVKSPLPHLATHPAIATGHGSSLSLMGRLNAETHCSVP